MKRPRGKDPTNTIQGIAIVLVFVFLATYGFFSLMARDPVWFVGGFEDRPSRIIVYHHGERTELRPGEDGFEELSNAAVTSLEAGFARLTSLGLSEPSLQDAYTRDVSLELFFERPVEIHTWFSTGRTTQMLFLITGRYSELKVVMLGDEGDYRSGAPQLKSWEPVREALKSLGYY